MHLRSRPIVTLLFASSFLIALSLLSFWVAFRLYSPKSEISTKVTTFEGPAVEQPLVNFLAASGEKLEWRQPLQILPLTGETLTAISFSGIPGTVITNGYAVGRFRDRWKCISQWGQWIFDPNPRHLHWPDPLSPCDLRHMETAGNMAGRSANEAVTRGVYPDEWTVRESLKYVWSVSSDKRSGDCGAWTPFNVSRFCQALGGRKLLIAGDSLSGQFAFSLLLRLKIGHEFTLNGSFSSKCAAARTAYPHLPLICFSSPICETSGHPSHLFFVRSDYLEVPVAKPSFPTESYWWVEEIGAQGIDVLILNRGVHYVEDAAFEAQLQATLHYVRDKSPSLLIIVRSSAAGHADCMNHSRPISQRLTEANPPHNWAEMSGQNRIAERLADSIGAAFLDVDQMTALRPDSHIGRKGNSSVPGSVDCLHYCIPGPYDGWSDMLFNMLLDLLP